MPPASPPSEPFYDPGRSYADNYDRGPFGLFATPPPRTPSIAAPAHTFLGHAVNLPFGIPAGPLINGRFVKAALDFGFDLPIYKTVRTRKYPCHPWPNVLAVHPEGDLLPNQKLTADEFYTNPLSITNSFGVPSFPPDVWQQDLARVVTQAGPGQVVIGSFQGTTEEFGSAAAYIADFATGARLVHETGVKIIEANLSCPNEGTANLLCFDIHRAAHIVEAIRKQINRTPLMVKVAWFESDDLLRELVSTLGPMVDAIAAINTIPADVVNARGEQALPGTGRLRSGVCGASIRWAGLDMATRLHRLRASLGLTFSIVGVGGVTQPADYTAFIEAGADAVMSATGAMWNPLLAQQIKEAQA